MPTKKSKRGGRRTGAGRKPKPPAEKQGETVGVKFTTSERLALQESAGTTPLATFVRALVLRHLTRQK